MRRSIEEENPPAVRQEAALCAVRSQQPQPCDVRPSWRCCGEREGKHGTTGALATRDRGCADVEAFFRVSLFPFGQKK